MRSAGSGCERREPACTGASSVRLGIRVQIVLALAGLLVLAFVPLFFAVAGLTRSTLRSTRDDSARSLGRAVAAHVSEARKARSNADLEPLLQSEIGSAGLVAVGVYDADGKVIAVAGERSCASALPRHVPIEIERTRTIQTPTGRALEVLVPGDRGPVVALLSTDDEAVRAQPLVRLVALYIGIFALALMVFAFMALTRLIVRPIDQLSAAARRVSAGATDLEVPTAGARELADLGMSFATMTRQLRSEEEALKQKIEELERATEELRSAHRTLVRSERLASVGRLSAGLAHEIGNPIAAILGFQDLLLSGDLTEEEQRDFLQRMKRETERIHEILRQLLDFARPAAIPKSTKSEPDSVVDAVQDACALIRPQRSFRDIEVVESLDGNLPLVPMSRGELTQVLVNLLLNAADAIHGQGHVWVRASRCDHGVQVEVEDDGPGIAHDVKDTLFEPFVTTKDIGAGTGLGLSVCRGLVEAAGGTITVSDGAHQGAVFTIMLPAAVDPEQPATSKT